MSSSAPQILDHEAIENLRALGEPGDDSFLKEILEIYLLDTPERLAAMKTARDTNDQPLYTRSVHTIKGSSANVGAAEMRTLATELERRSKQEPLATLDPEVAKLESAFIRARDALRGLIG
jgi:HPt (histidine-containing phosphotransfer) domain-containing protein